jgi:beta-glucuronidase
MKTPFVRIFLAILMLGTALPAYAQNTPDDIVRLSWKASQADDMKSLSALVDEMLKNYEEEAKAQAARLHEFPPRDKVNDYKTMSDLATTLFIRAELLMRQGKNYLAIAAFKNIIAHYPWAQAFDPSRGAYWSVAEKSQSSIDEMQGKLEREIQSRAAKTVPILAVPGTEEVVDWTKYGKFMNVGTKDYHYEITDKTGLTKALGEGIYPNIVDIYKDPGYKKAFKAGRLEGDYWSFVNSPDLQAAFYKWASASESWGVKLFYIGVILERAKMYPEAIKAYYDLIVNFPSTLAWTYWQTPWYPAQAAVYKIKYLIRMHPEVHMDFSGAKIKVLNPDDAHNYVTITNPGKLRKLTLMEIARQELRMKPNMMSLGKPVYYSGQGQVRFVRYESGHWQLLVDNQPFFIKGMSYMPTKVGESPDAGTMQDWMQEDENRNGIIDSPYESWVDKNHDNTRHPDEPTVGDFKLMKEMGVNTLRIYYKAGMVKDKPFLQEMYKKYGFKVALSNFLGKYAIGSGAAWSEGTDYENPVHCKNMMAYVRQMVMEFKDEPYILMWVLGNENNYGVASNANKKPEAYYKFVNEVARMIKSIDPNHPVAICNGDILFLDKFAQYAPDVDAYGANVYRGNYGFGSFWDDVRDLTGKPTFISEYGCPAFGGLAMSYTEAEDAQVDYHKGNWLDILDNSAGFADGSGNSVGGIAFEWLDEWWKDYSPSKHDTKADVVGPFPGGYYFEEWFGVFGQGNGVQSPYLREPRKVYYTYKELWQS